MNPSGILRSEFPVPAAGSSPQGITAGPDGNFWFTEAMGDKIGRITPAGGIAEFTLPTTGAGPQGITRGPDGNVWFTEVNTDKVGPITPQGSIQEVGGLTAGSFPFGITTGPDGNLWLTERNANQIARLAPHALSGNQQFVNQVYRDLLGRDADAGGLTYFAGILDMGLVSRAQVALAVENSLTYRIDRVEGFYLQLLGRPAEPLGLMLWVDFLAAGHKGQELEAAILASPEYFLHHGGTEMGFLVGVYQDGLHRLPDPPGALFWQ
jgi:hypothetical protein